METYAEVYERVLNKCGFARDRMRSYIEIQEREGGRGEGYMLLARHEAWGRVWIQDPDGDPREWAKLIVDKLVEMEKVEPAQAEEAYPF
jgi:hypothetical protein